jgi:uncharacterized protein YbjT (DUF2867 family)
MQVLVPRATGKVGQALLAALADRHPDARVRAFAHNRDQPTRSGLTTGKVSHSDRSVAKAAEQVSPHG